MSSRGAWISLRFEPPDDHSEDGMSVYIPTPSGGTRKASAAEAYPFLRWISWPDRNPLPHFHLFRRSPQ